MISMSSSDGVSHENLRLISQPFGEGLLESFVQVFTFFFTVCFPKYGMPNVMESRSSRLPRNELPLSRFGHSSFSRQ